MSEILSCLIHTSIASSLLILFIFILRFIFKGKINPRLQYALWIIVAVRLIIPFNLRWTLEINNIFPKVKTYDSEFNNINIKEIEHIETNSSYFQANTKFKFPNNISQNYYGVLEPISRNTINILFTVWIAVTITLFTIFIIRNVYFYKITIKGIKPYNFSDNIYDEAAETVGLKKHIPVYFSQSLLSPCIIGVINPIIILTNNVIQNPKATRLALIHEMVHYKRKDNIIRLIENILCAIYWFNPLVWLAAHSARNDAELACDSIVLKKINPSEHYNYCLTLLSIATNSIQTSTAMSFGGSKIKKRINMILNQPKRIMTSILAAIVSILLGLFSFVNISFANNFVSDEIFTIKSSASTTSKVISLGNIQEVYELLTLLPNPNDYYKINTVTIDNTKYGYSVPNNLDITYELRTYLTEPEINESDIQTMNNNALQLFNNIYDLEYVTFTYINRIANSGQDIKETPIAYSYRRSQIENKFGKSMIIPHIYKRVMKDYKGNNEIVIVGYSDLYAKAGISKEEFKKNSEIAKKVFSKLGTYSYSWGSDGKYVYRYSPNPIYNNWFDLVVISDGNGNIESHRIILQARF